MNDNVLSEKNEWMEYLTEIRPDLSTGSKEAYSNQLMKVSHKNNLKQTSPIFLMTRLANKSLRDKKLSSL